MTDTPVQPERGAATQAPMSAPAIPPVTVTHTTVTLPPGVEPAGGWLRFGSYLLEGVLITVTLGIGWIIWAAMTGGSGQTPAKRLLHLRAIGADTLRPLGMGRMFWMRWFVGGIVAGIAITFTLGILAFMPFWDRRKQNIWDKVSSTYVVQDHNDAWGTKPRLT